MKKSMLIAASALMIAGMTSCKKEYTCTCTTTTGYSSSNPVLLPAEPDETTSTATTFEAKKSESEENCKKMAIDYGQPTSFTVPFPSGSDDNNNITYEDLTTTITTTETCKI
jgi:hypothetical protein